MGFRGGDPARRYRLATAAGADARGRAAASPAPALRALGGHRAEGVAGSVAAARSQSGGRLQRRVLGGRAFPPGGSECAARRRGGTPSPPEWPATGDRLSWRSHLCLPAEPAGPRASDAPGWSAQKVSAASRRPTGARTPAMFVNQQLPSDLRATERKGGDRRPGDTRLPAHGCGFRLLASASPPARRRHLVRNLPGAYRNLLCGVTAFRLNPASSSRPSSRPLRRSRMLARCAAPPPGSWGPWEDAAPSPDAAALGPVVPASGEAGKRVWWGRPALAPRPGALRTLGTPGRSR